MNNAMGPEGPDVSYSVRSRTYTASGRTVWQVDIHCIPADETGCRRLRFHPKGITSKGAAKRWAELMEADLVTRGDPRRTKAAALDVDSYPALQEPAVCPTLAQFRDTWLNYGRANRQKPSTLDNKAITFRAYLSPVLGKCRLNQIGAVEILKLKAVLAELSASSANQVLLVLSSVLTTARKLGLITEQPKLELVKVPATRKIKHLEPDEFEALVTAAAQVGPTSLAVVLLAGDAGLRLGELIALRPKDLDLSSRLVHVNTTVWHEQHTLPKGGEPRTLPMSSRLVAALQGLDLTRPDVINRNSAHGQGQCTPDAIANLIKRAARHAGLGHVHAHLLRHTLPRDCSAAGSMYEPSSTSWVTTTSRRRRPTCIFSGAQTAVRLTRWKPRPQSTRYCRMK